MIYLLLILLIAAMVIIAILSQKVKPLSDEYTTVGNINVYKKALLTPNEAAFYVELRKIIPPQRDISCKCRLEDLMGIPQNAPNKHAQRNRIKSRHVDFVIFDPQTGNVDYVIELDDSSHRPPKKQCEDQFKNMLFAQIGVLLIRIKARQAYNSSEVYQEIMKNFGS